MTKPPFETTVRDGVCQIARESTEWLSTGFDGGRWHADVAYNCTVPSGWSDTDLRGYVDQRLDATDFEAEGPALLTGVDQRHARVAVFDPVGVVVTAGLSNPATVPPRSVGSNTTSEANTVVDGDGGDDQPPSPTEYTPGTINIIAVTTRALEPGALANLVSVVTEAKTATLQKQTGFSGTTSDAVVVGCDRSGEPTPFSGSATSVGRAARACVRDALTASLASRYVDEEPPQSVAAAKYGCETTVETTVSTPTRDAETEPTE